MTAIDPYVQALLLRSKDQLPVTNAFARISEIIPAITSAIDEALAAYGAQEITDSGSLAAFLFNELVSSNVFTKEEVQFAGTYYKYNPIAYRSYRQKFIDDSEISAVADRIGGRFFSDVFAGYTGLEDTAYPFPELRVAPGSDRIITFSDNQITEIETDADTLIDAVTAQNQIGDNPGLRELILGQLRAGRELIRGGTARLYLIELTLFHSLSYLIKRYENELVGALASTLMTVLAKHIGIDI